MILLKSPSGSDPEHSIIAVYQRQQQNSIEFRLDLLDLVDPLGNDVYLALESSPGGNNRLPGGQETGLHWNTLLVFPSLQAPYAIASNGQRIPGLVPRIVRDPALDIIVLLVEKQALPGDSNHINLQAFITAPNSTTILDQTQVLTPGSSSPPSPAPLLLAFWNSLPASTPVQTLRRWNGAHTGPFGQRHGLSVLVEEASAHHIPITLLDLKTPASLSGLDLVGGTNKLIQLETGGSVSLPLTSYGDPASASVSLAYSRKAAQDFGFRSSQLGYGAFPKNSLPKLNAFFYSFPGLQTIFSFGQTRLLPLPQPEAVNDPIASQAGLSVSFKKTLLGMALDPGQAIITAGGSLPASELADSSIAPLFFEYIAVHPWIKPLSEADLLLQPAKQVDTWPLAACDDLLCTVQAVNQPSLAQGQKLTSGLTDSQIRAKIRTALSGLPSSTIKDQAYQAFFELTLPMSKAEFSAAQSNYLGQVGYLLAAAEWAQNPVPKSDCSQDLDWDGAPECVLASTDVFAVLKLEGGRLVFAGLRRGQDVQQWIGQKSQFAISWDDVTPTSASLGPASDPTEIPGALFGPEKFSLYQSRTTPGTIELTLPVSGITKKFSLDANQLTIQVSSPGPYPTRLPVVLNPAGRFSAGWLPAYPTPEVSGTKWSWQPPGAAGMEISISGATFSASSFLDSSAYMTLPEIPDRLNPPGHYLAIPLALLTVQSAGNFEIYLRLTP